MSDYLDTDSFYDRAFSRTALLMGGGALRKLRNCRVLVCGVGGVGSYAASALVRSGIGNLALCDFDLVSWSNLNRQAHATTETIGQYKTDAMSEYLKRINPHCNISLYNTFINEENIAELTSGCDYVIDAIDSVASKLALITHCARNNIAIVSSMGAGNKLRPEMLEIDDIYRTSVCPLAKVMRTELRKRGVSSLSVCYSKEPARSIINPHESTEAKAGRRVIGSVSFVPPVAGMIIAGEAIRQLAGLN